MTRTCDPLERSVLCSQRYILYSVLLVFRLHSASSVRRPLRNFARRSLWQDIARSYLENLLDVTLFALASNFITLHLFSISVNTRYYLFCTLFIAKVFMSYASLKFSRLLNGHLTYRKDEYQIFYAATTSVPLSKNIKRI